MVCSNPFYLKKQMFFVPCGKCLGCRINRRGAWVTRMVLEASNWYDVSFLTLTYDDENLPKTKIFDDDSLNPSTLEPSHLTSFFKRFRRNCEPYKIRYFACGEYGEKFGRPHYHAIIFGMDSIMTTYYAGISWKAGHIYAVPATIETMSYVGGYVAKKISRLAKQNDVERFRTPEFCRVSRNPGLGAVSLSRLFKLCRNQVDVIDGIRYNGKYHPLPRFIKEKLRSLVYSPEYVEALKSARVMNARADTAKVMYDKDSALKRNNALQALQDSYRVKQVNYDISHLQKRIF